MNPKPWYVTTPIYYSNGVPHIGHFYSSLIAHILATHARIRGYEVRFTTGIDENSQKSVIKAREQGKTIEEYLDEMASKHKALWDFFHIGYTDFIRTTEKRHYQLVKEVLLTCFQRGDIYEGTYEGLYCVDCEAFKKEEELIEFEGKKVCPDHLKEPQYIVEKNYFFRLSKYETWLKEFYAFHPHFVIPSFRFNEVKEFVNAGLEDFSISREKAEIGIPLPFDTTQKTYVWFDALFNYYTSCYFSRGGEKDSEIWTNESERFWKNNPNKIHVIGKDILRFHAVYWPCMLASYFGCGKEDESGIVHFLPSDAMLLPSHILTTGFLTIQGQKMSKTLGNVIQPKEYSETYGKEVLILYLLSAFPLGNDGDYNTKEAIAQYNAKLADNLGNLITRFSVLALQYKAPIPTEKSFYTFDTFHHDIETCFQNYDFRKMLEHIFSLCDFLNKYIDDTKPRKITKEEHDTLLPILATIGEGIRHISLALFPFFQEKMEQVFHHFGFESYSSRLLKGEWNSLIHEKPSITIQKKIPPLFEKKQLQQFSYK